MLNLNLSCNNIAESEIMKWNYLANFPVQAVKNKVIFNLKGVGIIHIGQIKWIVNVPFHCMTEGTRYIKHCISGFSEQSFY